MANDLRRVRSKIDSILNVRSKYVRVLRPRAVISIFTCLASAAGVAPSWGDVRRPPGGGSALRSGLRTSSTYRSAHCRLTCGVVRFTVRPIAPFCWLVRLTDRPVERLRFRMHSAPVSGMRATSSVVSSLIVAASCCVAGVAPLGADVLPVL